MSNPLASVRARLTQVARLDPSQVKAAGALAARGEGWIQRAKERCGKLLRGDVVSFPNFRAGFELGSFLPRSTYAPELEGQRRSAGAGACKHPPRPMDEHPQGPWSPLGCRWAMHYSLQLQTGGQQGPWRERVLARLRLRNELIVFSLRRMR